MKMAKLIAGSCLLAGSIGTSGILAAQQSPAGQIDPNTETQTPTGRNPASANRSSMAGSEFHSSASQKDKEFLAKASQGGLAEVEMGKIASTKAKDPEVKQFAQKMIEDHTKLLADMKPFADQLGVTPPAKLSVEHEQTASRLKSLSGEEFDKEYIKAMVADHHADLAEFSAEKASASDPGLRQAVANGTEVIRMHTQMIDKIAKKNGMPTPPMPSSM